MPSLNDLEGYCGETSSSLIQLSSMILAEAREPGSADAAGHAGVAYAITGLLRAFPWHARQGQVFIPADILASHGVVREDIVTGRGGPGLNAALANMRAIARRHMDQVRTLRSTIPPEAMPSFRPLSLVEPYLRQMDRRGYDPLGTSVDLPQWRKIWALWRGPF
jgi:phytoene synthase